MRVAKLCMGLLSVLMIPLAVRGGPGSGAITGKVTFTGTPAKAEPVDMSKEPACLKMYPKPLLTEKVVTGQGNSLGNVVVYVSSGADDAATATAGDTIFDQQGCRYTTHVLAVHVGQNIRISNNDPFSHNIHPLAKINREWNRIQPAQTPSFTYAYDKEEFIHVKCNIHAWMQGYFAVLKTSHFAVTSEDGTFTLLQLAPGKYTVTAWHEVYGTQSREITIGGSETQTVNFLFYAKP
jgi:plastocyanin